jgi:hypothetical protein
VAVMYKLWCSLSPGLASIRSQQVLGSMEDDKKAIGNAIYVQIMARVATSLMTPVFGMEQSDCYGKRELKVRTLDDCAFELPQFVLDKMKRVDVNALKLCASKPGQKEMYWELYKRTSKIEMENNCFFSFFLPKGDEDLVEDEVFGSGPIPSVTLAELMGGESLATSIAQGSDGRVDTSALQSDVSAMDQRRYSQAMATRIENERKRYDEQYNHILNGPLESGQLPCQPPLGQSFYVQKVHKLPLHEFNDIVDDLEKYGATNPPRNKIGSRHLTDTREIDWALLSLFTYYGWFHVLERIGM